MTSLLAPPWFCVLAGCCGRGPGGPWALTMDPLGFRRAAALQEGLRQAVAVPLALAEKVASLWPALQELAQCGNLACRSDLQVLGTQPPIVGEQRGGSLGTY